MENSSKNQLEKNYDQIYSENEHAFGGESGQPESLVTKLPAYGSEGTVLELGAGQGRNGLWLARRGYRVEATDISSVGVDKMNTIALDEELPFRAVKKDSRSEIEGKHDVIVSTYMLHHLTRPEALKVLEQIKDHTKDSGYNCITTFTSEGDFFSKDTQTDKFYPNRDELRNLYQNWEIIFYEEVNSRARAKKEDGSHMFNVSAKIIARKSPGN